MVMPKALSSKTNLVPLELYKLTPKTNCGDCGYPSCLAFATHVIKGETSVDVCPHMDKSVKEQVEKRVEKQQAAGYGLKMKSYDFVKEDFRKAGLEKVAQKHNLPTQVVEEKTYILLPYFNDTVLVNEDDVIAKSGRELDEQEKMFIYNYLLQGGGEIKNAWVGMEGLPGSISKVKSLKAHCEDPLIKAFQGRIGELKKIAGNLGARFVDEGGADLGLLFQVFPRLPILILFWDADPADNFPGRVKFLYDKGVLDVLDLESLTFASETLANILLNKLSDGNSRTNMP